MAKFCTKCGAPLAEGRKFCVKCGTKLAENPASEQKKEAAEKVALESSTVTKPVQENVNDARQQSVAAKGNVSGQAGATQRSSQESAAGKSTSKKIAIIALCLVVLAGVGGFFGFKIYKENNYVQAAAKVQSVLAANQTTLGKIGEIKSEGYPDNAKSLAEEISKAMEELDKTSGEFGLAEEADKYSDTAENIKNVISSEKKLLESVRFLLENPGDKDAAGKLADAKTAIGEVKEAAGKISIKDVDFASCTDLAPVEKQLTAYADVVKELKSKGLLQGTGQSGNDLSSYVTLKDSYDSRIAALAVEINNYTASHQNFAGATALISKAQGLKDEIRATKDKFAGANAGTAEQKEKLLAVFDAELGRISGLLEGMQASAAGGNYEAGFKRGTDAAYRYDYVNAAFNQVK